MKTGSSGPGFLQMGNKRGSATVLLAMITVAMSAAVLSAILISRGWAIRSESEVFGRIWAKAILSEYDRHLLEDYHIMAFHGGEYEISEKLQYYMDYSIKGKLRIRMEAPVTDLSGYEMRDPANFKKALRKSFALETADTLKNMTKRHQRDVRAGEESSNSESRIIRNKVVLDTLPSSGIKNTVDISSLIRRMKKGEFKNIASDSGTGMTVEMLFIRKYFNSRVTTADSKKHFFSNEMEYVLNGSADDEKNASSCQRKIFLIRNALNLTYLYSDPEKVEIVTTAAELITPGPAGAATQALIMEAWAALEAKQDIKDLLDGGRVPLIKTSESWKTDFGSVLDSDDVKEKLYDDARRNLHENEDRLHKEDKDQTDHSSILEGLTYDDYLTAMLLIMNDNVRLLRVMDIVQINMKYRYYRDFNWEEYYGGVRFAYCVNGHRYAFKDQYR